MIKHSLVKQKMDDYSYNCYELAQELIKAEEEIKRLNELLSDYIRITNE